MAREIASMPENQCGNFHPPAEISQADVQARHPRMLIEGCGHGPISRDSSMVPSLHRAHAEIAYVQKSHYRPHAIELPMDPAGISPLGGGRIRSARESVGMRAMPWHSS